MFTVRPGTNPSELLSESLAIELSWHPRNSLPVVCTMAWKKSISKDILPK